MGVKRNLAELYEVGTERLMEEVKRNSNRFQEDLMFELSQQEFKKLEAPNWNLKLGRPSMGSKAADMPD